MLLCLGVVPFDEAHFGGGSASILSNQINCSGMEPELLSCEQESLKTRGCGHSRDAGVRCGGIYIQLIIIIIPCIALNTKIRSYS